MLKRVQHDNLIPSPLKGEEKKAPCEGRKREKKAADGVGIKGEREEKKGGVQ